jgi:hypothetical protein
VTSTRTTEGSRRAISSATGQSEVDQGDVERVRLEGPKGSIPVIDHGHPVVGAQNAAEECPDEEYGGRWISGMEPDGV